MKYTIIKICENAGLINEASEWFHCKWKIPKEVYAKSMSECVLGKTSVPQWYVVTENDEIIAGIGVIENDFHNRRDLSPNVCAVYVEKEYRGRGIAGDMLNYVCEDFSKKGIDTLYLLTDHTAFYERYGWNFLCMVQGDGEEKMSRMYYHTSKK